MQRVGRKRCHLPTVLILPVALALVSPCQATTSNELPEPKAIDSSSLLQAPDSEHPWTAIVSTEDLVLSSDGERCGPSWFEWHGLAVWSSVMPVYRQRYGWDLRWGFCVVAHPRLSGVTAIAINEREARIYENVSLRWTIQEGRGSSVAVEPFYRYQDGSRRAGIMVAGALEGTGASPPRLSIYLGIEAQRYFRLRDWSIGRWQPADLSRLQAGLAIRSRESETNLVRMFAGAVHGSLWCDRANGSAATWKLDATCGAISSFGSLRLGVAFSDPRSLYQNRVDAAREGRFASAGPGELTGNSLVTIGAEGWRRCAAGLYAVLFATGAPLGARVNPLPAEAGVGIGLKAANAGAAEAFKLRIDFPLYSTVRDHDESSWSLRRLAIRVWLWPGVLGGLSSPDGEYASE
jgi:hypothetical protein